MTRALNRIADSLLAQLVPNLKTEASTCVYGQTIWRTCYCERGMRIGQPCYYVQVGSDLRCACFACQAVIGAC